MTASVAGQCDAIITSWKLYLLKNHYFFCLKKACVIILSKCVDTMASLNPAGRACLNWN